jgi:hypothetical protein
MSIDKTIYNNGVKGLLSHYEIETLPEEYEIHKGNFHEMTEKVTGEPYNAQKRINLLERIISFFRNLIFTVINKITKNKN